MFHGPWEIFTACKYSQFTQQMAVMAKKKEERKKERQKEKVTLYKYKIKHQSIICKMLLNSLFIVYKL